jgi:hypothetical protein
MSDYADQLRKFNRVGKVVQYEWFDEVADYIEELETQLEQTTEALNLHKVLYVDALKQNIKLKREIENDG